MNRFRHKSFVIILVIITAYIAAAGGLASLCFAAEQDEYVLGIGDILSISVWGHDDLRVDTPILPDGSISFPLIGTVKAEGFTISGLQNELAARLGRYVKDPHVFVMVKEPRKITVQVLGEVISPGPKVLPATQRSILDAYSSAGGATEDGDITMVMLTRAATGEKIIFNLSANIPLDENGKPILMNQGDILMIPKHEKIIVIGAVRYPGAYRLERGSTVIDAIAAAGGPVEKADLANVSLLHKEDYEDPTILKLGEKNRLFAVESHNTVLAPGDIVYVPEREKTAWENIVEFLTGLNLIKDLLE